MLLPFSCRIWRIKFSQSMRLFYNKRNFTSIKDPKRNVFWMVTVTHASSISHQPFGLTRTISVNFEILPDPRFHILIWLSYLFAIFSLIYSLVIIIYFLFLLWSVFPLCPQWLLALWMVRFKVQKSGQQSFRWDLTKPLRWSSMQLHPWQTRDWQRLSLSRRSYIPWRESLKRRAEWF